MTSSSRIRLHLYSQETNTNQPHDSLQEKGNHFLSLVNFSCHEGSERGIECGFFFSLLLLLLLLSLVNLESFSIGIPFKGIESHKVYSLFLFLPHEWNRQTFFHGIQSKEERKSLIRTSFILSLLSLKWHEWMSSRVKSQRNTWKEMPDVYFTLLTLPLIQVPLELSLIKIVRVKCSFSSPSTDLTSSLLPV